MSRNFASSASVGPCPYCRSTRYTKSGSGHLVCEFGHQSQDYWEEQEGYESTHGSTRTIHRSKTLLQSSLNLLKTPLLPKDNVTRLGDIGRFFILEGIQVVLKNYARILRETLSLPLTFDESVKNLWLAYISINDIHYDEIEGPVDGSQQQQPARATHSGKGTAAGHHNASSIDEMEGRGMVSTQDTINLSSQTNDDDIEISDDVWDQSDESDLATDRDLDNSDNVDAQSVTKEGEMQDNEALSDNDLSENDGNVQERPSTNDTGKRKRQRRNPLYLSSIAYRDPFKGHFSLTTAIIMCYLVLRQYRAPILMADIHKMLIKGTLPYFSAHRLLPKDYLGKLGPQQQNYIMACTVFYIKLVYGLMGHTTIALKDRLFNDNLARSNLPNEHDLVLRWYTRLNAARGPEELTDRFYWKNLDAYLAYYQSQFSHGRNDEMQRFFPRTAPTSSERASGHDAANGASGRAEEEGQEELPAYMHSNPDNWAVPKMNYFKYISYNTDRHKMASEEDIESMHKPYRVLLEVAKDIIGIPTSRLHFLIMWLFETDVARAKMPLSKWKQSTKNNSK